MVSLRNIVTGSKKAPYRVRAKVQGKLRSFGYYDTEDEATLVRDLVDTFIGHDLEPDSVINDYDDDQMEALMQRYRHVVQIFDELEDEEIVTTKVTLATLDSKLDRIISMLIHTNQKG